MAKLKWSALEAFNTGIDGSASAPTLKGLAAAGQKLGNEIDPTGASARNLMMDMQLKVRFLTAPAAGAYVEVFAIQAVDGTQYSDGDDTVTPSLSAMLGTFPARAVATQQFIALRGVVAPATKFKFLVINRGSTAFTNTDAENILSYRMYDVDIVA